MTQEERIERAKERILRDSFVTDSGCWEWLGCRHRHGYADMSLIYNGIRLRLGHVIAYTIFRGEIPEGLELDHTCKFKPCVNPWHVEPVTHAVNLRRAYHSLTSADTVCQNGHSLMPGDLLLRANGKTICVFCNREWQRKYRLKRRPALSSILNE